MTPTAVRTRGTFALVGAFLLAGTFASCRTADDRDSARPNGSDVSRPDDAGTRDRNDTPPADTAAGGDTQVDAEMAPRLFGTSAGETVFDLAYGSKSGDLYITGMASENFQGQQNAGALDIFVGRLDPELTFRWIVLFGSDEIDEHPTLDVHEPSERVYVSAETRGAVGDQSHVGAIDVFATAFDTDGDRKWTRTLGSPERVRIPRLGRTLVADASGMYLPVTTRGSLDGRDLVGDSDALVWSLTPDGTERWRTFLPDPETSTFAGRQRSHSLAPVPDTDRLLWLGLSITGDSSTIAAAKLSADGELLRTHAHPTDQTIEPVALAPLPENDSYTLAGTLAEPRGDIDRDLFVWRIGSGGEPMWKRHVEGPGTEFTTDLRFDSTSGRILLAGTFDEMLFGARAIGERDVFVAALEVSSGETDETWTFGSPEEDWAKRLTAPTPRRPGLIGGLTEGNLAGLDHAGDLDGFLLPIR